MNRLVAYLAENHHPGGNSFKIIPVETVYEAGFTVEEFPRLALEASREKYLLFSRVRVKGGSWGVDEMIPGDIDHLSVTRKGIAWYNSMHSQTKV